MNNNKILPILITLMQILSFGHLYYTNEYGNSHIPIALIESTLLSLLNILVLIGIYFLIYKPKYKIGLWSIPICLAILMILAVLIVYSLMFLNKYN
jgi:hypothetical protein